MVVCIRRRRGVVGHAERQSSQPTNEKGTRSARVVLRSSRKACRSRICPFRLVHSPSPPFWKSFLVSQESVHDRVKMLIGRPMRRQQSTIETLYPNSFPKSKFSRKNLDQALLQGRVNKMCLISRALLIQISADVGRKG